MISKIEQMRVNSRRIGLTDKAKYEAGALDMQDALIDKAIEWIKYNNENGGCQFDNWEESFKKAMEE